MSQRSRVFLWFRLAIIRSPLGWLKLFESIFAEKSGVISRIFSVFIGNTRFLSAPSVSQRLIRRRRANERVYNVLSVEMNRNSYENIRNETVKSRKTPRISFINVL